MRASSALALPVRQAGTALGALCALSLTFNIYSDSMRLLVLLPHFLRQGNRGSERLSNLLKATQLICVTEPPWPDPYPMAPQSPVIPSPFPLPVTTQLLEPCPSNTTSALHYIHTGIYSWSDWCFGKCKQQNVKNIKK